MRRHGRSRLLGWVAATALGCSGSAFATAGFAEWEIFTPGGHLISHVDGWKEQHGTCLRSEPTPGGASRVFVAHLERWRYYEGYVVGQSRSGHFVFDERTERVHRLSDDKAVRDVLTRLGVGGPVSPWLMAADGWEEAWFPFYVWKPCRDGLQRSGQATWLTPEACAKARSPEKLDLLRRTTWGRHCERAREHGPPSGTDSFWAEFCATLGISLEGDIGKP